MELPGAAEALAEGALSAEHVDQLARAANAISPEAVEASDLIRKAKCRPADLLGKDVREFTRLHTRREALEARHARLRAARRCVIFDNDEGMTVLHAEFDPVRGAELRAVLGGVADRLYPRRRRSGGWQRGAHRRTAPRRCACRHRV